MDSYPARVAAIVNGAHERVANLASELRDEEECYREATIRDSEDLEQSLKRASEHQDQPEQPQEPVRPNRDSSPSWDDDDDFSDNTWLENVDD
ncbi:hypothetical protein [Saccharopolyspora spinosa]|uniref:Uncharacterized protein n=1 Tax=Saccharopolyspora spinosa TaxID=60894 RepID=A0A2N3XZ69_SACSN|nr:hypothetical protein [Saccharopolyspora spinosa]PKW15910.1 hypothetical protein A8926_3692 [Saccharopolyspora spinosa]